jgi:hypothetical protein
MRNLFFLLAFAVSLLAPAHAAKTVENCALKGKSLYGKVQVVDAFADFKVQVVASFPDLRVQRVKAFPDACGKWEYVNAFPDFTIEYVNAFPDFRVEFVESFPGEP